MRHLLRKAIVIGAAAFMMYLPAAQATGFHFGHQAPQAPTSHYNSWRGKAGSNRGHRFNRRGHKSQRGLSRWGQSRNRGFGHQRGKHRGQGFGNRGFNRGNLHGFNGNGYYQKRKHYYRDKFGRLRYYYR